MATTYEQIARTIARVHDVAGVEIAGTVAEMIHGLSADIDLGDAVPALEGIIKPLCVELERFQELAEMYDRANTRNYKENGELYKKVRRLQRRIKKLEQEKGE